MKIATGLGLGFLALVGMCVMQKPSSSVQPNTQTQTQVDNDNNQQTTNIENKKEGCRLLLSITMLNPSDLVTCSDKGLQELTKDFQKDNAKNHMYCAASAGSVYNNVRGRPAYDRVPEEIGHNLIIYCSMLVYGNSKNISEQILKLLMEKDQRRD